MAASQSQGKPAFVNITSPLPIHVEEEEGEEINLSEYQDPVSADGWGCFGLCGFDSCWGRRGNDGGGQEGGERVKAWWGKKLKKAKEFSEVVAGPKWKNFIRKAGGYFNKRKNKRKNPLQYDAESYALNFDEGGGDFDTEEVGLLPSFSSRFPPHFPHQQPRPGS